ncbi:hypothetical protein ABBQ38_014125 [Trebouxia sp. C0009 RCD-2024]
MTVLAYTDKHDEHAAVLAVSSVGPNNTQRPRPVGLKSTWGFVNRAKPTSKRLLARILTLKERLFGRAYILCTCFAEMARNFCMFCVHCPRMYNLHFFFLQHMVTLTFAGQVLFPFCGY